MDIDTRIKKLEFEIKWVEDNKKYATWEVAKNAYERALVSAKFQKAVDDATAKIQALEETAKTAKDKTLTGYVNKLKKAGTPSTQAELDALEKVVEKVVEKAEKRAEKVAPKNEFINIDQSRRDGAFWAKTPMKYYKEFIDETGKTWNTLNSLEKEALYYYTHTYCPINEPLRGQKYIGDKKKLQKSLTKIPYITSAIDKSEIPKDVWLMKGDTDLDVVKSRFGVDVSGMNVNEARKALLGKEGVEKAFVSCGSSKGTGFNSKKVITNIFVPKGAKGFYVEPISAFGNGTMGIKWDGLTKQNSVSKENETLLQRGTKFKITKVDRNGDKWYIDVDVIGQEPLPY